MTEQKIVKPSFREEKVLTPTGIVTLEDFGLEFNTNAVGPMNSFYDLRNADYGKGFLMSTMPELVYLVYASLENQNYASAENVIKALRKELTGNTGVLSVRAEEIYVQDNPNIRNGRVSMTQKTLQNKLGSYEERGVIFSDDRNLRFTPYNFKVGEQSSSELAINTGLIALVGGEENAERFAKASRYWKAMSHFWVHSDVAQIQTTVADLSSNDFDAGGICLGISIQASHAGEEHHIKRASFGVRDLK